MPLLWPKGKQRTAWLGQLQEIFRASPAGGRGDPEDPSDPAWWGAILGHRPLESVFLLPPLRGRKEDAAPSGQGVPASRFRLAAGEPGRAVRNARALLGVRSFLGAVALGSRSVRRGLLTLAGNCAGARRAGNPLAPGAVAGAGNQLTVRLARHSQRKRGATDRPNLRSNGASPRPYRDSIRRATSSRFRITGKRILFFG